MSQDIKKPIIGFSCGDLNGVGIELIIKSLSDSRLLDFMVPVIFASNKSLNFYKKLSPEFPLNYASISDLSKINPKQVNLIHSWEEEVNITPGELTNDGGKYAFISLQQAVAALKEKKIDGLVTAPIHKRNQGN